MGMQRVVLVQHDIVWQDVEANLRALEHMLEGVVADVVVLPEMFQTGFVVEPSAVVGAAAATLEWMRRQARRMDAAVVGSFAVREDDRCYNRMYFVRPDGVVEYYDKRHLFSPGGEAECFTAGAERRVVEWRGVRYLLQVCYDLRFPVWSRQRGDYDVALYVALWPKPRREVWRTLLRARAIENQAYVIGVNRVGMEPGLEYSGDSMVVDACGRVVMDMESRRGIAVADIDIESLGAFRSKFAVWRDADSFVITKS